MKIAILLVLVPMVMAKRPPGSSDHCPADDPRYKAKYMFENIMCFKTSDRILESGVSAADKKLIIDIHNAYRRQEVVKNQASNIMELVWSEPMARNAQQWASMCVFGHDSNRRSIEYGIMYIGQNSAFAEGRINWTRAIEMWHNEIKNFEYGVPATKVTGHYTQVIQAKASHFGCGYAMCKNPGADLDSFTFICNYAYGQNGWQMKNPYKKGDKCSGCKSTSAEHCKDGLCSCGGLICKNAAGYNPKTCTCKCHGPFSGPECDKLTCEGVKDHVKCGDKYKASKCNIAGTVAYKCPIMCGLCPKK